jgi:hypothetical protein
VAEKLGLVSDYWSTGRRIIRSVMEAVPPDEDGRIMYGDSVSFVFS